MFDGYDDPILDIGSSFDEDERTLPFDKFGWFYKVRATSYYQMNAMIVSEERDLLG